MRAGPGRALATLALATLALAPPGKNLKYSVSNLKYSVSILKYYGRTQAGKTEQKGTALRAGEKQTF